MAQSRRSSGENRCSPSSLPEEGTRVRTCTFDRPHRVGTTEAGRRAGTHHPSGEFNTRHPHEESFSGGRDSQERRHGNQNCRTATRTGTGDRPSFLPREQRRGAVGGTASRPANYVGRVRRIPSRAFQRRPCLRYCTLRRTSSIGISRQLQLSPGLPSPVSQDRGSDTVHTEGAESAADHLVDAATPKTTSPTTSRSGGGRSSPAAHTSK